MEYNENEPVAVEQKQIHRAQQELEKEIAALSETVQALENSLELVLTPPVPNPTVEEPMEKSPKVLCGLAGSMFQDMRDVVRITTRVKDMMRRLQV